MASHDIALHSVLSADERSEIAELEATGTVLKLVTRLTGMRFAGIAKFTEKDWIVCSVYDPTHLGIESGNILDLEITLCSELRRTQKALFIPKISDDRRYSDRRVVKQYGLESYAGAAIFLPDGRLFGALCALDSRSILFEDPELEDTLILFAKLIGCIFFTNLAAEQKPVDPC